MFQESVEVRNAKLDAACACIGKGGVLRIFSGAQPDDCAANDPDGLIVEISLPSPCMERAENGSQESTGEWIGEAIADGEAVSFRICTADGSCCRQGSISQDDGDLLLDNVNIHAGQMVTVRHFTVTAGNA